MTQLVVMPKDFCHLHFSFSSAFCRDGEELDAFMDRVLSNLSATGKLIFGKADINIPVAYCLA